MGFGERTYRFMRTEGFGTIASLYEMDDEILDTLVSNARKPAGTQPLNPNDANNQVRVPIPAFSMSARSVARLKVAHRAVKYYVLIKRAITPEVMRWRTLKAFDDSWKIVEEKIKEDRSTGPKVDKKTTSLRNFEDHFNEWLESNVGRLGAKLSHVVRKDDAVPAEVEPLADGKPYSEAAGSLADEFAMRCDHEHPAFAEDNAIVFDALERALRGTTFYATLRPHSKSKDGRAAWFSVQANYLGEDKLRQEIVEVEDMLNNRQWKANGYTTLERFANMHRVGNERLKAVAERTNYQLPDERRKVERFLEALVCSDPEVRAAVAQVKANKDMDGPLYSFDKCVEDLLPTCPIARKKRQSKASKGGNYQVNISSAELERVTGSSGVELGRYYSSKEYATLTPEQKNELRLYRLEKGTNSSSKKDNKNGKGKRKNGNDKKTVSNKQMKTMVASVVKKMKEEKGGDKEETPSVKAAVSAVDAAIATSGDKASEEAEVYKTVSGLLRQNLKTKGRSN